MKKTLIVITMLASALLPSSKGMSQTARPLPKPGVRQSLPLLQKIQPKGKVINKKQFKGLQAVDASTTLWVNAKGGGETGYFSFHPTSPLTLTKFTDTDSYIARNGVQIADGHLYGVYFQRYGVGYGELTLYDYDLSTWTGSGTSYDRFDLAALETAQAADGTVYGEFYNATASNTEYELGTVDYRTRTRTTFGKTSRRYVAMGITSDNLLYGIASDGNLYQIDKTNGAESLIGSTGLTLTDDWGGPYEQTGEIDQKDNIFYWYAQDCDYNTALYTVDLSTGAATKIAESNMTMVGMTLAAATTSTDVPATVSNLNVKFDGTALTGKVSFSMPTHTAGGMSISDPLTYTITANNSQMATGTALPGKTVEADISLPHSGQYNFDVTVTNNSGTSAKSSISKWVGYEAPEPVGNLKASVSNGIVTISWSAPTIGVNGGALSSLTYDIYQLKGRDTTLVAKGINSTSYVDNVSEVQLSNYVYAVRAVNGDAAGAFANTASIIAGQAIEPNWSYEFQGANALSLFKVIDGNGDGNTWWCNGVTGYGAMSNQGRATLASDEWLVTPPVHLSSDRIYTIAFRVRNMMDSPRNTLEVKYGTEATPDGLSKTALETFSPDYAETNGDWQVCHADIIPDADGYFYFGFHDNTEAADKYQLAVDSITITKGGFSSAPDSVTNLSMTVAEEGKLEATLKFTAATRTINGKTISYVEKFEILRDGTLLATIPQTVGGNMVTYTDYNVPTNGYHTYEIVPYLDGNPGRASSIRAYIGLDLPTIPKGVTFADEDKSLKASWNAFGTKGIHGGYIDPEEVSVSFYTLEVGDYGYEVGDSLTTSTQGSITVSVPFDASITTMPDGKTQTLAYFTVRANNRIGHSDYTSVRGVVVGPSIPLPFSESFRGGNLDNGFASLLGNDQYNARFTAASWQVVTDTSSDSDGGSLRWSAYSQDNYGSEVVYTIQPGDETSVNMPKVALAGVDNPRLSFDLYSVHSNEAHLQVLVQTPDGIDHKIADYDLTQTSANGWTNYQVDLTPYTDERYVIVKFNGVAIGSNINIGIDNIDILDQVEHNMTVKDITTPESVVAGKSGKVIAKVRNIGAQLENGYSVVLYANNEACDTVTTDKQLRSMEIDSVELALPVRINESAEVLNVKAEVVLDNDILAEDNISASKKVKVVQSPYGRINDLNAKAADGGRASLSWGNPVLPEPETVTDGFESYSPFSKQLGLWTLIDGDKGNTGALQPSSTYPGQGEPAAFIAFNPDWWIEDMTWVNPGLSPYDGGQYAAAIYALDSNNKLVNQDNWIISPKLSGRRQVVSFYVMNIAAADGDASYTENFDVLYSTTDTDTTSFVKLESNKADGTIGFSTGANWKYISMELPEGARYFAIHHNTLGRNSYIFGVDDVNYEQLATGADDNITGFIVYCDGKAIGSVDGDSRSFVYDGAEGDHTYNVTVLYTADDGSVNESGFSNDASLTVTGIQGVAANAEGKYNVYTVDGKAIMIDAKSLKELKPGVYIINDKKYIIK